LIFLGVQPHPFIDRGHVAGSGHPQGDEHLGPGEDVLVEHRGPLGDHSQPDPTGPAAAHQVLDRPEQALPTGIGALRGERVGLVQHQVQRVPVPVVQPFREIGHEPACGGLGQGGQVQYRGDAFVDDQVGEQLTGGLGQRQVGVITAEDDHR